eukprot:CAMPEP_0178392198 /NCGR_PEP_ID=MMETSP0689_2-20121128/11557_1 /TAXON_ID=160604 /ORGANISM="Amphidinium massartii, Strain CS-259" /LENGTH=422 /DNA_ID=CAMNT_0020012769 /DNA_START=28 /DNA_END=1293 /DNA_ORIENTATION=-
MASIAPLADKELKLLVVKTLETNGILGQIRAQLRANVYKAIDAEGVAQSVSKLHTSSVGQLMFEIVVDFLEFYGFQHSLSVIHPESGIKVGAKSRSDLAVDAGLLRQSADASVLEQLLNNVRGREVVAPEPDGSHHGPHGRRLSFSGADSESGRVSRSASKEAEQSDLSFKASGPVIDAAPRKPKEGGSERHNDSALERAPEQDSRSSVGSSAPRRPPREPFHPPARGSSVPRTATQLDEISFDETSMSRDSLAEDIAAFQQLDRQMSRIASMRSQPSPAGMHAAAPEDAGCTVPAERPAFPTSRSYDDGREHEAEAYDNIAASIVEQSAEAAEGDSDLERSREAFLPDSPVSSQPSAQEPASARSAGSGTVAVTESEVSMHMQGRSGTRSTSDAMPGSGRSRLDIALEAGANHGEGVEGSA